MEFTEVFSIIKKISDKLILNKKYYFLFLFSVVFIFGCDKLVDQKIEDLISEEEVFSINLIKDKESKEALKEGIQKYNEGDFDSAIEIYNRAISMCENNTDLYIQRANAYVAIGQKFLALQDYKKALYINSNLDFVREIIKELEMQ